jgi:CSLREA domain-containing protein
MRSLGNSTRQWPGRARTLAGWVIVASLIGLVGFVVRAGASASIVVNSTGDDGDANIGDGVCETSTPGQCTLRAAIQEANANATIDTIHFAIPTTDPDYSATRGVFTITPGSDLPELATSITIDGTTQTVNIGDTNPGTLGYVGPVGTGPDGVVGTGDEPTLDGVAAPEIELAFTGQVGFSIAADDARVSGLAVFGANSDVRIVSGTNVVVEHMVIGTRADSFTDPGPGSRSVGTGGVSVFGGSGVQVRNNLIGYQAYRGVHVHGDVTALTIQGNEIRATNQADTFEGGGIEVVNYWAIGTAAGVLITGNLIDEVAYAQWSVEIALAAGDTGIVVDDNTLDSNEAVLVYGNQNSDGGRISHNVMHGSPGYGVLISEVIGWTISENSIVETTLAGIRLQSGGNETLVTPTIIAADSTTQAVGFEVAAPTGDYVVEFFANTAAGPGGYGDGETYLASAAISHPGGTQAYVHSMGVVAGVFVTATLTKDLGGASYGSTSEFSAAFTATGPCLDSDGAYGDTDGDTSPTPRPRRRRRRHPHRPRERRPQRRRRPPRRPRLRPRRPTRLPRRPHHPHRRHRRHRTEDLLHPAASPPPSTTAMSSASRSRHRRHRRRRHRRPRRRRPYDDDGGTDRGAVHILFMNADGTVRAEQKISDTDGGLTATLDDSDNFGSVGRRHRRPRRRRHPRHRRRRPLDDDGGPTAAPSTSCSSTPTAPSRRTEDQRHHRRPHRHPRRQRLVRIGGHRHRRPRRRRHPRPRRRRPSTTTAAPTAAPSTSCS